MRLILISLLASLALVGAYVAAGGAEYRPSEVADPCLQREWREPNGIDELGQQLVLSGIDGAACDLGVTREALARALATDEEREKFMAEHSISEDEFDTAVRAGLNRMVDDAEEAGEIGSLVAAGLRALVRVVPAREAFELLMDARPLLERALGTGSDLGLPGFGGSESDSDEPGLGEQLRKGLEDLGQRLNEGLGTELGERLDEGLGGNLGERFNEGLGRDLGERLNEGLGELSEALRRDEDRPGTSP